MKIAIAAPLVVLLLISNAVVLPFNLPSAGAAGISLSEDAGGPSSKPQIAVSGSNVHVAWLTESGGKDIFLASSSNDGETFEDPVNLSDSGTASVIGPEIAASGSNVYVVWPTDSGGIKDIFLASSSNDGETFEDPVNLSDSGTASAPEIAVSGSNVYVVWQSSGDIFLASSSDDGGTFSDPTNLSGTGASSLAQVAASGSNVHVVWQDASPENFDVFYVTSSDGGNTTADIINLSSDNGSSRFPQLAVSGDNIHVVWENGTGTSAEILSASSSNSGESFSAPVNVSDNAVASNTPQLAVSSGGDVYVVWSDKEVSDTNSEIFLSISNDGGITFDSPVNLSDTSGASTVPQIALAGDGTNAHVVWQDAGSVDDEIMIQANLSPEGPSIVLNPISNTDPKWGDFDPVEAFGSVGNAESDDKVLIDWGDGNSEETSISGSSWGPVTHFYDSSAIGSNTVVASLLASDDAEKAVSSSILINVTGHTAALDLDQIPSVKEGLDVTAEGTLLDGETGAPISGASVTFTGSGAENLDTAITDSDGAFSSTGLAVNGSGQIVQAHFDGNSLYQSADSELRSYNTVDPSAEEFPVTIGSDVHVSLDDFSATIDFEEVATDGTLYVSECSAPASDRYVAIEGGCLDISPGFQLAEGSMALLNMSYAGASIPAGFTAGDIGLFHEVAGSEGSTIIDITTSGGTASETVAGQASSFSKFILGAAENGEKPAGVHRTQIFVGDGNTVSLRDIDNSDPASYSVVFDDPTYSTSQTGKLTVTHSESNIESGEQDIVTAGVISDTSSVTVILTLTENAVSSGVFENTFGFTTTEDTNPLGGPLKVASGDDLSAFYIPGARFRATIDGVTESDIVELSDIIVGSDCPLVGEDQFLEPIGGGVNFGLLHSELDPDATVTATLSYANAALGGDDPSALRIVHHDGSKWIDITLAHDPAKKTITGQTDSEGQFSLGFLHDSCFGGAGGGFGRGLIVDAVASVASSSGGSSGGGGGGGGGSSSVPRVSSPSAATSVLSGDAISTFAIVPAASGFLGGQITLNFEHVILPGSITVREEVPATGGIFDSVAAGQGSITSTDGAGFMTAGPIFDIVPSTNLQFEGMVEVVIPYSEALARAALGGTNNAEQLASAEASVRFMHYNGTDWEDLTTSIDPVSNTVTGKVSSFSRVVAAVVDDETFGSAYIAENPTSRMAIKSEVGSTGIAFADAQGAAVTAVKSGTDVSVVTTVKNLQRTSQEYLYVVEIFNSRGIVVDIDTFTGTLDQAQEATLDQGSLRGEGEKSAYTVKVFLLDESLNGSIFLAPVAEAQIPVVS